jgi:hypothetical protein
MVVVEHVPSDVDRIILVSRAKRYSRVVDFLRSIRKAAT